MGRRSGYVWEYQEVAGATELVVCLSAGEKLQRWVPADRWSTLFLADQTATYFTCGARSVASKITAFAVRRGYTSVIFIGSSKAGFGALLLGGIAASLLPHRRFLTLSFCPQVSLYPFNETLHDLPSYVALWERARGDAKTLGDLQANGDPRIFCRLPNLRITLIYNGLNRRDAAEASKLDSPTVNRLVLPFPFHNATLPFLCSHFDRPRLEKVVGVIYRSAQGKADLMAALPEHPAELVESFLREKWIPPIGSYIRGEIDSWYERIGRAPS